MASYSSLFFHIPQLPHTGTAPPASTLHLRSFLSLDIADSVLSRSSTIHTRSRRTSSSSDSTAYSFFADSPVEAHAGPSRASSASSTSSQRSIPRAKPAPRHTALPPPPPSTHTRRSHSTPRAPPRTRARSPAPPVPTHQRSTSIRTGTSTVSTHYRRTNRTDALARLEGRSPVQTPQHDTPPPYLSQPPPKPRHTVHRTKSAAPILATKSFMPFSADSDDDSDSDFESGWGYDDAKDVRVELVPVPSSPDTDFPSHRKDGFLAPPPQKERRGRSRAGTIESWLVGPPPMSAPAAPKNFMDFDFAVDDKRAWSLGEL